MRKKIFCSDAAYEAEDYLQYNIYEDKTKNHADVRTIINKTDLLYKTL